MALSAEDLQMIRQIIREELRAAHGIPIAQPASLEQSAARNREIKMQELAEKRTKRDAAKGKAYSAKLKTTAPSQLFDSWEAAKFFGYHNRQPQSLAQHA
ncbi:hypothetical protein KP005_19330 [Geomonas nitrogeniifigens]|uniref:Uncharacterized protein n=1 Tax=Geomonas diazotrophica TaxID=2843197 RepID=A0ABX8JGG2_9BACT|nr:hypothetical protein [Geomonas nitrogeniifigens]QWV97460.1 hypothetical protein KP005_19330 [Geomonas nitrogeniifigens]